MSDDKPMEQPLPEDTEMRELHAGVIRALHALPAHFTSPVVIEGVDVKDLFGLNQLLGGAMEVQTVTVLNQQRQIWDPRGEWAEYEFRRYSESFPDVRLVRRGGTPVMGIELKSWYLLSKEKEPSLRFCACVDACAPWDLVVCAPWSLSNVLSGKPVIYEPYVVQARHAADMRTWYWNHRSGSNTRRDCTIEHPVCTPYPDPRSRYLDVPAQDGGGNFGRLARIPGLMDTWCVETLETPMSGIRAKYWVDFFLLFRDGLDDTEVWKRFERLSERIRREQGQDQTRADELLGHLEHVVRMALGHG